MERSLSVLVNNATEWAMARLGSTEYRLQCLAFVEDALERSNHIEIFGGDTAKESADLYEADRNTGLPPAGAFVFYDCSGTVGDRIENWGHVGLCVGQGEVIHAWDRVRIDGYLAIEDLGAAPGWSSPKYVGWAPLERILVGSVPKAY